MCRMRVDAGACRMSTVVTAEMDEGMAIRITIESDCPNIERVKDRLGPVDPFSEISNGFGDSAVYGWARELPHVACPVPCAIVKCVEVEGGLGVKRDVSMGFERAASRDT